jgi:hypothetical protein
MAEASLSGQVANRLSFLFADYGARVVSSPSDEEPYAYETVVVELLSMRIRISTQRSDICVEVAPMKLPHRWEHLASVLSWWDIKDDKPQQLYRCNTWDEITSLLRPNLRRLNTRLSTEP